MPSTLPFHALHVFMAVARHQGIRPASAALHVTPGAVSRQMAALESHLGCALLERRAGSMASLTPEGQRLLQRVQAPMDSVVQSLSAGSTPSRHQRPVIVNTSVTLAMHWLIPQLPRLAQDCPGLRIEVQTDNLPANPQLPVDLFIRRDPAELRPLPVHPFLDECSALVVGPRLWTPSQPLAQALPRLLRCWPRVATRSRPDLWPAWCLQHGFDESQLAPPLMFDNTVLAIQATMQGLGTSVLPLPFLGDMLAACSLSLLPFQPVPTGQYAFAVKPGRDAARLRRFTDWLQKRPLDPSAAANASSKRG